MAQTIYTQLAGIGSYLPGAPISNEALIQANPDASKTDVHRQCKGSVSWLYKWEPKLLTSLLAAIPDVREKQLSLEFKIDPETE
jgi:hypothetical protein